MVTKSWKFVHQENLNVMKMNDRQSTKDFDAVQFMREQRTKLSQKLALMTKDEIIAYFKQRQNDRRIKPSA